MTLTHRLALVAMFASAAAFAQSSSTPSSDGMGSRSSNAAATMSPTAVLSLLQQVDQDELRLAQMAQSKATSDKVKDYAKDMIKDHDALDRTVSEYASQNKLTLSPSAIPSTQRTQLKTLVQTAEQKLGSATGSQFDLAYMQAMAQSHASVLTNLDAALPGLKDNSQDSKLYDLVKTAREKVSDHRKHADDILRDMSKSNAATGGSGSGMSGSSGSSSSTGSSGSAGASSTGR